MCVIYKIFAIASTIIVGSVFGACLYKFLSHVIPQEPDEQAFTHYLILSPSLSCRTMDDVSHILSGEPDSYDMNLKNLF